MILNTDDGIDFYDDQPAEPVGWIEEVNGKWIVSCYGIGWDDVAEVPTSLTTLPTYADAITVLSAHAMRLRDVVAR